MSDSYPPVAFEGLVTGRITAAHGRQYVVETTRGYVSCVTRGKRTDFACGDIVDIRQITVDSGVLESVHPRTSVLLRSTAQRTKLIAANATQVAIVVATEPEFSDELVSRILIAAENAGIRAFIILNKADLTDRLPRAVERTIPFEAAGYAVIKLCARTDISPILPRLTGESTVLVGQSGMGKSTLLNALVPGINAKTREISRFLSSGKHTTTHTSAYAIDPRSTIIDCPGVQEFGLAHLDWRQIAHGFREFSAHGDKCRFPNCRHITEPGCRVSQAADQGSIAARRLELYRRIISAERR